MNPFPDYDPDNPASETYLPISLVVSRLTKHRDHLSEKRDTLSRWAFRKRAQLAGAIAAYDYEIEALEQIGGATVLARLGIR